MDEPGGGVETDLVESSAVDQVVRSAADTTRVGDTDREGGTTGDGDTSRDDETARDGETARDDAGGGFRRARVRFLVGSMLLCVLLGGLGVSTAVYLERSTELVGGTRCRAVLANLSSPSVTACRAWRNRQLDHWAVVAAVLVPLLLLVLIFEVFALAGYRRAAAAHDGSGDDEDGLVVESSAVDHPGEDGHSGGDGSAAGEPASGDPSENARIDAGIRERAEQVSFGRAQLEQGAAGVVLADDGTSLIEYRPDGTQVVVGAVGPTVERS